MERGRGRRRVTGTGIGTGRVNVVAVPVPGFSPMRMGGLPSRAPGCLRPEARKQTVPSPLVPVLGDNSASRTGVQSRPRVSQRRLSNGTGIWPHTARCLPCVERGCCCRDVLGPAVPKSVDCVGRHAGKLSRVPGVRPRSARWPAVP